MSEKVEVDDEVYEVLKQRSGEKGFDSTDEYVNYVLGQVADKIERQKNQEENDSEFSEEDEKKVKERLRSLGYLD